MKYVQVTSTFKDIVKVTGLKFVYHITAKRFLDSIAQNGLQPKLTRWAPSTPEIDKARRKGKFKSLVFLTPKYNTKDIWHLVKDFLTCTGHSKSIEDLCIIRVPLSNIRQPWRGVDPEGSYEIFTSYPVPVNNCYCSDIILLKHSVKIVNWQPINEYIKNLAKED